MEKQLESVSIREEKMTREELRKMRLQTGLGLLFMFAILFVIVYQIFTQVTMDKVAMGIFIGFSVVFVSIFGAVAYYLGRDMLTGLKLIIEGELEDKSTHTTKSSKGRSRTSYRLVLGNKKYTVPYTMYNKVRTGDTIRLEVSKHAKNAFKIENLSETSGSTTSLEKHTVEDRREALLRKMGATAEQSKKITSLALTTEDILEIKKVHKIKPSFYVFAVFYVFMVFNFSFLGTYVVALLLIIMGLIFAITHLRLLGRKRKDIESGVKEVYPTRVVDKYHQSGNRKLYRLKVDHGIIRVSKQDYEETKAGATILVKQAVPSGKVFGIHK